MNLEDLKRAARVSRRQSRTKPTKHAPDRSVGGRTFVGCRDANLFAKEDRRLTTAYCVVPTA